MHTQSHTVKEIAKDISCEFKNFLKDVEDLVNQTSVLTGEDLSLAKEKLSARIGVAKERLENVGSAMGERARSAAHMTNEYVHEQPWKSVSVGAAFGLLLGFVLARRS